MKDLPLLAIFTLFLAPHFAEAALLKPESDEGRRVIRRLAAEATRTFINQTEFIHAGSAKSASISTTCEKTKVSLLTGINKLELNQAPELLEAKFALEKTSCPSAPAGPIELRKANDKFFAATLFLRESDARVN